MSKENYSGLREIVRKIPFKYHRSRTEHFRRKKRGYDEVRELKVETKKCKFPCLDDRVFLNYGGREIGVIFTERLPGGASKDYLYSQLNERLSISIWNGVDEDKARKLVVEGVKELLGI